MPVLKNSRHERYAQNLFAGMSQRKAYRAAFPAAEKWKDTTTDTKASELASNPEIVERIEELKNEAASEAVLNRIERQKILSGIATDEAMIPKARMQAIDLLNRMDGEYVKKIETNITGDISSAAAKVAAILDEQ